MTLQNLKEIGSESTEFYECNVSIALLLLFLTTCTNKVAVFIQKFSSRPIHTKG